MKLIDTSRVPRKKWTAWHSPQALLCINTKMREIEKTRGLAFHKGWLNPSQVVENGEIAVSLLQTATQEIHNIQKRLRGIEGCLLKELSFAKSKPSPDATLKDIVQEQIEQIHLIAKETIFKERQLLNGKLGIAGKGRMTRVLTGSAYSQEKLNNPVRVELLRVATHSVLTGHQQLTDELVRQETQIALSENGTLVKYKIASNETVESLIEGLRALAIQNGLDLEVRLNDEGLLEVSHRQYGSPFVFSGRSQKTRILSKRSNSFHLCQLGENCLGKVNGRFVKSRGQLLLCEVQLDGLEGLSILWENEELGIDYLTLSHNAVAVPGGHFIRPSGLWIAIRSCDPNDLAQGVNNKSGFASLADVSPESWQSTYDTLYFVQLSLVELAESLSLLATRQTQFEEMAMRALEATDFGENQEPPRALDSESIALMATMLEQVFAPQNRR